MKGLVAVLEDRLRHAPAGAVRCGVLAELAIARAQSGDLDRAEVDLRSLKSESEAAGLPRHAIQAMICDGVIDYYKNLSSSSFDRVFRASVLARAASDSELIALSNVWLAHTSFNFQRWDILSSSLRALDQLISVLSLPSIARLALTIADIAQYCGRSESAESWYQCARSFSRLAHDHGLLVAIESNRLLLRLDRLRILRAFGFIVSSEMIPTMRTELLSLRSIHEGFGSGSILELLLWAEATEHEFSGRYREAVESLKLLSARGPDERSAVSLVLVGFESSIFETLANSSSAEAEAAFSAQDRIDSMSDDDALIAIGLLKIFAEAPGIPAVGSNMEKRFGELRARCERDIARLSEISANQDAFMPQFEQRILSERGHSASRSIR